MITERVVDLSAYTGDLSPLSVDTLIANQVTTLLVQGYGGGPAGTGPNPSARQQAGIWLAAGGERVGTYSWPPSRFGDALNNLSGFPLWCLAYDVEASVSVERPMIDGCPTSIKPLIYTSQSQWQGGAGFSDVGLWDARYPRRVWDGHWFTNVQQGFVPYGGWTRRVGWQFAGTTTLQDDQFDLNIFEFEEDDMTPEEARAIAQQVYNESNQAAIAAINALPAGSRFAAEGDDEQWLLVINDRGQRFRRHLTSQAVINGYGLDSHPFVRVPLAGLVTVPQAEPLLLPGAFNG